MKIKHLFVALLYLFMTHIAATAQQKNTLLWSIQRLGETESYIFITGPVCGTALSKEDLLQKIAQQVKTIAVEVDLYSKEAQKIARFNYASNEKDKINSNLSSADFTKFLGVLKDAGYSDNVVNAMYMYRLSIAYMLLTSINGTCIDEQPLIWEVAIKKLASKNKMEYKVLCSVDSVIAHMSLHTNQYWVDNILPVLHGAVSYKAAAFREASLYASGNVEGLKELYSSDPFYKQKFDDSYQFAQAGLLAIAIGEQVKNGPTLFTVDVANIATHGNLLFSMLKKMGFEIRSVE